MSRSDWQVGKQSSTEQSRAACLEVVQYDVLHVVSEYCVLHGLDYLI
jgi:hypothetical protein